jgi:hypothetical protein
MSTPEETDPTPLQGPCPRCGKFVDAMFKFCPHCGLQVCAVVAEVKSEVVEGDRLEKLSPEARQRLLEFEQQFDALQKKMKSTPTAGRGFAFADSSITKFAVILGALILLGVLASWYIISQFIASMTGRAAGM